MPVTPRVQVKSNIQLGIDDILEGISQLDNADLESFLQQVSRLLARRKAPSLSGREAELLLKINRSLPADKTGRYQVLTEKLNEETITPEEHQELSDLVDFIENQDAERLACLVELANLRGISLDDLMNQLGLTPPAHA